MSKIPLNFLDPFLHGEMTIFGDSKFNRPAHRMGAIAGTEFGAQALEMMFDSHLAQAMIAGNLLI